MEQDEGHEERIADLYKTGKDVSLAAKNLSSKFKKRAGEIEDIKQLLERMTYTHQKV